MADRYWRGGTGSWTTTNTANWSTTSGGAGGASVPTPSDRVFFDQAGTYTVTLSGSLNCAGITVSAGTVTFTSTGALNIYGSMSLNASTTWSATGLITFSSAAPGNTILTNGVYFATSITINGGAMTTAGVWGEYTLQSSLTISGALTLTNGRFNTAGYAITTSNIAHTAGCYDFGSPVSTITCTGSSGIILNTDANRSWVGRPNIITTATGNTTQTITANGSLGSLVIGGGANTGAFTINGGIFSSITHSRTTAFTVSFGTTYPVILESWGLAGVSASVRLTVSGTVYLMARPASGVAVNLISTLNCYGCPIYADTASTVTSGYGVFASAWQAPVSPKYWVGGAGDWSNTAKWSTTSGGVGGTAIPWADEDVIFDANSGATAFTITTASAKMAHKDFTCTRSNITLSTYGSHMTNHVITGNINSLTSFDPGSYFNGITVWGGTGAKTFAGTNNFLQSGAGSLYLIGSSYTFSQATTVNVAVFLYNGSFNPGIYTLTLAGGLYTLSGDAKAWNNGSCTTSLYMFRNQAVFNTTAQASTANIIFNPTTGATFDLGISTTWGGIFTLASSGGSDLYIIGINSSITNIAANNTLSRNFGFYGGVTIDGTFATSIAGTLNLSLYNGSYYTNTTAVVFNGPTTMNATVYGSGAGTVTFNNTTTFNLNTATSRTLFTSQARFNTTPTFSFGASSSAASTYILPASATYNAGCTISFPSTITGTITVTIPSSAIAGTLAINNASTTFPVIAQFSGNVTANTAITSSTTNPGARITFNSSAAGTQRTLSTPSITLSNINFQDIFASGAAIPWSGSSFGNLGNNTNITFSAARNVYWNLAGSQSWTANGWAATSGGVPSTSNYPLPQDTAVFDDAGAMGTVSIPSPVQVASINASARTLTGTLTGNGAQNVSYTSSIVLGTGLTAITNLTFISITSATTFTSAGRTISGLTANTSITLTDAVTATGNITVNSPATLFTAGYNVTAGALILNPSATISAGSGASPTLTLTGTGTTISGTLSGSLFNVVVNSTGASNIFRTAGAQYTYGTLTFTNTTASATTTIGGGLFSSISRTGTAAQTISFNPTYAFSTPNFNLTGSLGNILTLKSSTTGTAASINISSGSLTTGYLRVQDLAFTPAPATNGSTPYVLYAGSTSASLGNVTGLLCQDGGVGAVKAYLITTIGAGTWTVPTDWNSGANTIHLVGGGGGASGTFYQSVSNKGGAGGGGGGYKAVANYSAGAGASVSFTVGVGGTGGAAGGNGGTGGSTIWAGAYTATGGQGGYYNSGFATFYGGAGGTGDYTGGTGGNGGITSQVYGSAGGGGGGGAASPGYNGKNGGFGGQGTTYQPAGTGGGGGVGGALSTNGSNAAGSGGGVGGAGPAGTGGGALGQPGSNGGGGGGVSNDAGLGGAGGYSATIANTFGPSGGPGGSAANGGTTGRAGTWGAGAGGGSPGQNNGVNTAGATGGQGFIFILYTPSLGTYNKGGFFPFFS